MKSIMKYAHASNVDNTLRIGATHGRESGNLDQWLEILHLTGFEEVLAKTAHPVTLHIHFFRDGTRDT